MDRGRPKLLHLAVAAAASLAHAVEARMFSAINPVLGTTGLVAVAPPNQEFGRQHRLKRRDIAHQQLNRRRLRAPKGHRIKRHG